MNPYAQFFCFVLFIFEMIIIAIHIIYFKKSTLKMEDNEQLLNTISYNLNYEKIKELKINKYYYLYEFNKILIPNSSTYNVVRRSTLSIIISYSFIPYIILNLIGCIQFCSEKYLAVMWLFCICGIINISSLINSFFYPYKVDIPGKEIYIFEESFKIK